MNVGIVTMHRLHNYGSFLQAFALKKIIESYGHYVEFIDIVSPINAERKQGKYDVEKILRNCKRVVRYNYRLRDILKWRHDIRSVFNSSGRAWLGYNDNVNDNGEYDLIVIGSDEVFNCADKVLGFRPGMFGHLLKTKRKISYAASFGYTVYDDLCVNDLRERVSKMLSEYEAISVRDKNSYDIVKRLVDVESIISLDPVFVYNYDDYIEEVNYGDYILIYSYLERISSDESAQIKKYASENGIKIISLFSYYKWADYNLTADPFKVLSLFKSAKCVVTDTFHGMVISIKYNKRFACYVRASNYNKITYVLKYFDLERCVVGDKNSLKDILDSVVSYDNVNDKINYETQKSISYLGSFM